MQCVKFNPREKKACGAKRVSKQTNTSKTLIAIPGSMENTTCAHLTKKSKYLMDVLGCFSYIIKYCSPVISRIVKFNAHES